jgi:hypothetical protein
MRFISTWQVLSECVMLEMIKISRMLVAHWGGLGAIKKLKEK